VANLGNAVHTIYVISLPVGPIWALHGFYLASTAVMLWWWLRYRKCSAAGHVNSGSCGLTPVCLVGYVPMPMVSGLLPSVIRETYECIRRRSCAMSVSGSILTACRMPARRTLPARSRRSRE
jgi:hypothetical protein